LNDGSTSSDASKSASSGEERRPDKTTAIASRLIAAAIGQRPAQRTKEQREYDQAMKVQEKKKRDQAKEKVAQAQREKEQAKKDIWGD
jgi:cell division protein FtsN